MWMKHIQPGRSLQEIQGMYGPKREGTSGRGRGGDTRGKTPAEGAEPDPAVAAIADGVHAAGFYEAEGVAGGTSAKAEADE